MALTNLGLAAERREALKTAREYYKAALRLIESGRRSLMREGPRIAYFGRRLAPYERLILIYSHEERTDSALSIVEQARARTFVDLLARAALEASETPLGWLQIRNWLVSQSDV